MVLGDVAERGRCVGEALVALALEREPADELSPQSGHVVDVAGVGRILGHGVDGVEVELGLAEDLEGAGVDHVGRGVATWPVPSLDHEAAVASLGQQPGCGEADRAGPDDQERHLQVDAGRDAAPLPGPVGSGHQITPG